MEETKKSLFASALKYGLIGGAILILIGIIYYVFSVNIFQIFFSLINFVITFGLLIVMMILGMKAYRDKELDGKINYGNCFFVGLIISFTAMIMSGVFNFLFYTYFDPEYMPAMVDKFIDMMEGYNLPPEKIEESLAKVEKNLIPINQLKNTLIMGVIASGVLSLIVSIFIKKEPALSASDTQL
ncbi:MAG: DUF4199 domain-containing protein [Saprospiraceae bacterium]|nr:DUF4199 domain-containing protein [Saprospiraceae bacterium]